MKKTLHEAASGSFIRTHRSYLVGVRYIQSISKTDVTLDSGRKIPPSRSNYQAVHQTFIRYFMGILKNQLYLSVSNSVGGEIRKPSKHYISSKNSETHGFGLMQVDRIAAKYNGYVNRQNEDGVFATEILLPL